VAIYPNRFPFFGASLLAGPIFSGSQSEAGTIYCCRCLAIIAVANDNNHRAMGTMPTIGQGMLL